VLWSHSAAARQQKAAAQQPLLSVPNGALVSPEVAAVPVERKQEVVCGVVLPFSYQKTGRKNP
jgi:hypothetical protein